MKIIRILVVTLLLILFNSQIFSQELITLNKISELDALRNANSGKVVLINLWASWCNPCVKEFPDLVRLYQEYKNQDFVLIFINLDFKEEVNSKVIPFLKNNNVDFTTYYLDVKDKVDDVINYFDKKWEGAIPATFIYDRNNIMVQSIIGKHDYNFFEAVIKKFL